MEVDSDAPVNGTEGARIKEEPKDGVDDEDPVVHEIPVYLSRGVNCYLFQYPVRPASMPYDKAEVVRAKFRPTNQQLQPTTSTKKDS